MDLKQSPFSIYDFLGYFIPGAVLVFVFEYLFRYLGMDTRLTELTALTKASQLLPFVLVAYVSGHLLSLLSSFTVERFYIWFFDYPSKSLLRYSERKVFEDEFSLRNIVKFINAIVLTPVAVIAMILCVFSVARPGMVHALDPLLTRIVRRKVALLIYERGQVGDPGEYAEPAKSDFFRIVYHFVLENSESHGKKMQNYVALFWLHRAMCLLFSLTFLTSLTALAFSGGQAVRAMIVSAVLSGLFFFGFAKFYRRFSLEALMALAVCYQAPPNLVSYRFQSISEEVRGRTGIMQRERSPFSSWLNNLKAKAKTRARNASNSRGGPN